MNKIFQSATEIKNAIFYIAEAIHADNIHQEMFVDLCDMEEQCVRQIEEGQNMLNYMFIRGLKQKISDVHHEEHIYMKNFEMPQINLFELLIKELPIVSLAQYCANNIIIDFCKKRQKAMIIDVGCGTGYQVKQIVKELAQNHGQLQELCIIGIEPAKNPLLQMVQGLYSLQEELPFEISVTCMNRFAEQMTTKQWQSILFAGFEEDIIVNASFALHHIQKQEDRTRVLQNLQAINPQAVVLSEPNVNHDEKHFLKRVSICYNFFGIVFDMIQALSVDDISKKLLKKFFQREIMDIVGYSENNRVERHEPLSHWLKKAKQVSLSPLKTSIDLSIKRKDGVNMTFKNNAWSIDYMEETLVAVMQLKPR